MASIKVIPVQSHKELKQFIRLPWELYKNDQAWVPPLLEDQERILSSEKNSYFRRADVALFLAFDGDKPIGRISSSVNKDKDGNHTGKSGSLGFFESINDIDVARSLFNKAEEWVRDRGINSIRGPFSFTINDITGVLIKGFEYPPMIMMGHSLPYYSELFEKCGYKKLKDLFAWHYTVGDIAEETLKVAEEARKHDGLVVRCIDMKQVDKELMTVLEVFNASWAGNWGFVPFEEKEMKKIVKDVKMIVEPNIALIAEIHGKPAAIAIALPNINEAIKDLDGRLFPFGIFKLLYRIKFKKIKTARLIMLGIKPEYRKNELNKALSVLLYVDIHRGGQRVGIKSGELSWTLEDNEKINKGIEMMGGKVYKIYRIYEKSFLSS